MLKLFSLIFYRSDEFINILTINFSLVFDNLLIFFMIDKLKDFN